jgi:mono/diheme cytochrome c family protein
MMQRGLIDGCKGILCGLPLLTAVATAADTNGPMSSTRSREGAANVAASAAPSALGPAPGARASDLDVKQLFASTCGWCHSDSGRAAGKGPKLMGTALTDAEIEYRIKTGKTGAMPAFGSAFNEDQLKQIVKYIRDLKPDGAAQ